MDVKDFNKPARPLTEIEGALTYQLLWMLLLRVILYSLLLGLTAFLQQGQLDAVIPPVNLLLIFIIVIYIITIGCAIYLLLGDKIDLRQFGFRQNLLDTLFVSLLVYFTGCSDSIFTSLYFFPVIAGGLILPRKGGLLAAAAASLQLGLILGLQYYNLSPSFLDVPPELPEISTKSAINIFAVRGLSFFLAAVLSAIFATRLLRTEKALSDTVQSLDNLSLLYKQIFDDIATGILTIDDKNVITSANNAIARITGYPLEELNNRGLAELFPALDLTSKGSRFSADLVRRDGEIIRAGYSHARLQHIGDCKDCKVITVQDISEVERLEKQMRQAEKLAAIGRMSAGIAHDFRNPLTAISGSAQVLANEIAVTPSPQLRNNIALVEIILRESNRLSTTIDDFLKFARPESAQREWFSLKRCLDEVIEVGRVDPSWPKHGVFEVKIDKECDIWADQNQLFTIFNHLLHNGLALCPGDDPKMEIVAREVSHENGAAIEIRVGDNGPGIEQGLEEKIFEPFFTKRVDGTGLGLTVVKQIVEEHNGTIEVGQSHLGGALFTVRIPLP
ncbi:MAG: ATP-binding protein [Thermodesulfobacteriota bacterium]